jgi:mannose-6-phosphate isomerase-like protein (cupin superfamily)
MAGILRLMGATFTAAQALAAARAADDGVYATLLGRGRLEIGFYAPVGSDAQEPHARDEIYVIISGNGRFERAGESRVCGPGDALFVPAGEPHRFCDFSEDFAAWVIFSGGDGPA